MAHSISWKTTTFESQPIATDKIGQAYAVIQTTRKAVGERIASEHSMDDNEDLSGNQGRHNVGAARLFYYDDIADLPAVPSTAKAFDADDGYAVGRSALVRYDTATVGVFAYKLWVYKVDTEGSAWVEPSYIHTSDVDEVIAGLKTFSEWPVVDDTTVGNKYDTIAASYPYGNPAAPDTSLATIKSVKQALTDYMDTILATIMPVGFVYVQYPSQLTPTQLWGATFGAKWTYEWAATLYDGEFFSAEGTAAPAFGAATQAQAIPAHTHAIAEPDGSLVHNDDPLGGNILMGSWGDYHYNAVAATTVTESAGSGTVLRPKNQSIRIWKRTTA
jgi:hypothetical protein